MSALLANRDCSTVDAARHARHHPEQTLLYQLVERHYPVFLETLAAQGDALPKYVRQEFENYLKCGRLEHGFLRIRCEACHAEKLVAFSCKRRGFCPSCGTKRMVAVTLIQRFGRYLERSGWLQRDADSGTLQLDALDEEAACMDRLRGHSITYRIAIGRHTGKKAFTLQTVPATESQGEAHLANAAGFSLHAGVWAGANDRQKRERICRYIARPAVSNERLALTECGHVRYTLKTPYRDGTTHVYFNPLDFIARLAALVPKPRVNLTRYHGVFAPNSKLRSQVTLSGRGKRPAHVPQTAAERHQAMTWAQRLKRVFQLDLSQCACGGRLKMLASIEDPATIRRILDHLERHARGPPASSTAVRQ